MSTAPESPNYADELAEEIADDSAQDAEPERDARPAAGGDGLLPRERYIDRQQSWLEFNARVLELAADPRVPLLERVRFLAIFAKNLDDFFMVRVAGLKRRIATGIVVPQDITSPRERLDSVLADAYELMQRQHGLFHEHVGRELCDRGIAIVSWDDLEPAECKAMQELFSERISPVLTPLAVDPAHPFPYISGLSLNLAVVVRDRETGREHFARVKVPPLARVVPVGEHRFIPVEEVIAAHLPQLFSGMDVVETCCFRVTRNEDVEVEEEEDVDDLLTAMERGLLRRRFGPPVRLEVEQVMSQRVTQLLVRELGVSDKEVYRLPAPLDLGGLWDIADVDRPELKYPAFVPRTHPRLRPPEEPDAPNVFAELTAQDVLVHHPYDSFATSVQSFLEQAAADPAVLAIKHTLYRTSGDSPIVEALIDAADSGKQVLVMVEIKARFDEQANIRWARALEQAGCHVVYGLVGLKTHCKLSLVVRQERDGSLRRYAHIGTGNYNPRTARIYEDFGLLTADPSVCDDVADLFNHLSGYTKHRDYDSLLVAPDTLRSGITNLIREQADRARAGLPSRIRAKMNSLVDDKMIEELYAASAAGVPIELLVRGMCSLRPGVPSLSETISVRSIVGRFLEHSRVYEFGPPGESRHWIGSADLMQRNLDRRVEALVQVRDDTARERLHRVLDLALSRDTAGWELQPDGSWERSDVDSEGRRKADLHEALIAEWTLGVGGDG